MVILSVLTLALSSVPYFKRGLTKCELEEYLGTTVMSVNSTLDPNDSCSEPIPDEVYTSLFVDFDTINTTDITTLHQDDIVVRDNLVLSSSSTNQSKTDPMLADNSTPVLARSFFDRNPQDSQSIPDEVMLKQVFEVLRPRLQIQKKTVRIQALVYLDTVILAFFSADLLMRLFTCPSVKSYFLSTVNVIDAGVIIAAYANIVVNVLRKDEKYVSSNFDLLEVCQVLRVVRLLRVVRNVIGFKVLTFSLKVSLKDLMALLLYLVLGVIIFANFIYFVECEKEFSSIPVGWWWAISTLTTVGYGDVTPETLYGRIIGGVCAISGVVIMAVAIPLLVKTFMLLYQYAVLYKKSINQPEDTNRYIHRQRVLQQKENQQRNVAKQNGVIQKEKY